MQGRVVSLCGILIQCD